MSWEDALCIISLCTGQRYQVHRKGRKLRGRMQPLRPRYEQGRPGCSLG